MRVLSRFLASADRSPAALRSELANADPGFARLTDADIANAVRRAGNGSRKLASTLAFLSLRVGAFGAHRKTDESLEPAIKRVAKSFRKATR